MTTEIKNRIEQIKNGEVPQGYKKTKVGIVPNEWDVNTIENSVSISNNERKPISEDERKKMAGDYPYYGPTQVQGFIDTFSSSGPAVLIGEDGDHFLKYREKSMTLVIDGKYTVNNHAHIIRENDNCMLMWFNYYFQHRSLFDVLTRQGAGRYKLTKDALCKINLLLPPLPEQQKIAEILTAQDKVIELKEKLIAEKEQQKKYLMQNLLTGKKRLKGFTGEWKKVELGDIFEYLQPTKYLVSDTNYDNKFEIPVLTAGKTFILGYTNEKENVFTDTPVVIFDDFTTSSKYVDFSFKAKSSAMKILKCNDKYNILVAFHAMQQLNYVVGGHERHWISKFSQIPISLPPLDEQNAIAEILSTADREIELLKANLAEEKQKKKALMQLLLTGLVRV